MKKARKTILALGIALLSGCASQWQAARPVVPTVTPIPEYRAARAVGNLRRLAILPVRVEGGGVFNLPTDLSEEVARSAAWSEAQRIARRLKVEKGYDVVLIGGEDGRFRPDAIARPELGTSAVLEAKWRAADTTEKVADAVRQIGRAVGADGVVTAFLLKSANLPDSFTQSMIAVANILTANSLLIYHASRTTQEIEIYETATGEVVWRSTAKGEQIGQRSIDLLKDLENAVPAVVTRP